MLANESFVAILHGHLLIVRNLLAKIAKTLLSSVFLIDICSSLSILGFLVRSTRDSRRSKITSKKQALSSLPLGELQTVMVMGHNLKRCCKIEDYRFLKSWKQIVSRSLFIQLTICQ